MDMPWTRAKRFLQAVARDRADKLKGMAIAARAAWLDGKDWEKWMKNVG